MFIFIAILTLVTAALTLSIMSLISQVGESQQERSRAWKERETLRQKEQREVIIAIESAKDRKDWKTVTALYNHLEALENEKERRPFNGIFGQ